MDNFIPNPQPRSQRLLAFLAQIIALAATRVHEPNAAAPKIDRARPNRSLVRDCPSVDRSQLPSFQSRARKQALSPQRTKPPGSGSAPACDSHPAQSRARPLDSAHIGLDVTPPRLCPFAPLR